MGLLPEGSRVLGSVDLCTTISTWSGNSQYYEYQSPNDHADRDGAASGAASLMTFHFRQHVTDIGDPEPELVWRGDGLAADLDDIGSPTEDHVWDPAPTYEH